MYDDILIPTDGSDAARDAIEHALFVAENAQATVHALYVVDTRITKAAAGDSREGLAASLEEEGQGAIATVREAATERGLDTTGAIRKGTPAKAILSYAEEAGIDLIVVGAHGKTPREKVQSLGSVSERVVDGASMPVFVVRSGSSEG